MRSPVRWFLGLACLVGALAIPMVSTATGERDAGQCARACLASQDACNKACGDDLACVQRCTDAAMTCAAKCK